MAEQLQPMPVNPGDPITSELLSNIVSNINIINSLSNSINGGSGGGTEDKPSSQTIIESGRIKVPCKKDGTGFKAIPFTKIFTARPNVICTIWQTSGTNFNTQKYQPIVTESSVNGFTVRMMSLGATKEGEIWVQWIACS
jgi:hypothetical protein